VQNFALIGEYDAKVLQYAGQLPFSFFVTRPLLESKCITAHHISFDLQLRYRGETIFKMADVCHVEFSKIAV